MRFENEDEWDHFECDAALDTEEDSRSRQDEGTLGRLEIRL